MTDQEKIVINKTVELWNEYLKLPVIHNDANDEMRRLIHAIQEKIFARPEIIKFNQTEDFQSV